MGDVKTVGHTPGEWKVRVSTQQVYAEQSDGRQMVVCNLRCPEFMSSIEGVANARLIAAAPALLEALTEALTDMEWSDTILDEVGSWNRHKRMEKARAALTLATGSAAT